jgi:hypothetical protein
MKQSQTQSNSLTMVIVDKTGTLKSLNVKEYKEEELFKKCGFKKVDGFVKHTVWPIKIDGQKYNVAMYGKLDGKANMENKYDFPPPIDTKLFFGACALVATTADKDKGKEPSFCNLSVELWDKMYEKLFGGFENLALTAAEDDDEEDELAAVPASKKTKKGGYLKDGFVVDSESSSEHSETGSETEDEDDDINDDINDSSDTEPDIPLLLEEIGSELSEEAYDYSSDSEDDEEPKKK